MDKFIELKQLLDNDKIEIRQLKWCNTTTLNINADFDYISYHYYMRR